MLRATAAACAKDRAQIVVKSPHAELLQSAGAEPSRGWPGLVHSAEPFGGDTAAGIHDLFFGDREWLA